MTLSFIGLEGEPSYVNVQTVQNFSPSKEIFTKGEKEVLLHLAKGSTSQEIGQKLFIARNTVDKHRRNMLAKTDTESTMKLIMKAVEEGWI
ncbi:MAG TPA: LuxR C-terminal-related transcriptional regulator [Salinimicrobium sp.]|nr:LuxR C-terminal-related transcriptional regulator [Salinimicrobium sp.]